jgi:hypothetical protein
MSRTKKDLRSSKRGFGRYWNLPKRKLTPFILDANKIEGKNEIMGPPPDNDIKQDDFNTGEHWHNAKNVRSIRKQIRAERDIEKSRARTKLKRELKKQIKNME